MVSLQPDLNDNQTTQFEQVDEWKWIQMSATRRIAFELA